MMEPTVRDWGIPITKSEYVRREQDRLSSTELALGRLLIARFRDPDNNARAWAFWTELTSVEHRHQFLFYLDLNVYGPRGIASVSSRATFSGSILVDHYGMVYPGGYFLEAEQGGAQPEVHDLALLKDIPNLISA